MRLACQMWSVKDIWQKNGNILSVFPQIAEFGYEGVQSMAFWNCDQDELEKALSANKLAIADMPINLKQVEGDEVLAKTVDFCQRFGVDFVYIPWYKPAKISQWREFAEKLDVIGERLQVHGIRIGYHHHIHEFRDPLNGVIPADVLIEHKTFNFELDVGPILESGRNPAKVLGKLVGRVPGIHAKPYPGTYAGAADDQQNWGEIIAAARAAGTKWLVVECEKRQNVFEDVKLSADYFRKLGV